MRKSHYGNEAEAMKRAQALMENEDDEDEEDGASVAVPEVPPLPNGVTP